MNEKKKKIAVISSGYFPIPAVLGGAVEALDENLIRQNEISNRVTFVVFSCFHQKANLEAKHYKNSEFHFIKIPAIVQMGDRIIYFAAKNILRIKKNMSYRYILQRLYYIKKVALALKQNDYDKVVLENHPTLFMTLRKYNNYKKYAGRYYYHLHNVVTNDYGCREIISNCKKVIGVSDYINGTLHSFLGEDDNNNYCVLTNMIDKDKFRINLSSEKKQEIKKQFGIDSTDKIILFSGRFNEEKGIRELLQAFAKIQEKSLKLLIVGGYYFGSGMVSSFEKEMYEAAKKMEGKVVFTGFIPYAQMPEVYAIADVVVIPSIWDDPAPLTVIESLTSGKALITTNSGGIPEYADNNSSIIIRRDEQIVNHLAEAMQLLINDEDRRIYMEKTVIEKTKDWGIQKFYNSFCELIDD